jgi:hypothetical protein
VGTVPRHPDVEVAAASFWAIGAKLDVHYPVFLLYRLV